MRATLDPAAEDVAASGVAGARNRWSTASSVSSPTTIWLYDSVGSWSLQSSASAIRVGASSVSRTRPPPTSGYTSTSTDRRMRWISSQGVGRDGRQITLAAGTPLVADTHHELATEGPDDLLAGVQVHAPRITGRDAATGDQQALEAVGMTGDKAEPGTGGQLEGREVRHVNQSLPDPRPTPAPVSAWLSGRALHALRQVEGPRRNLPWATMTADPPTSTVSTEVESPRARAKSTEGRPIWAP